MTLFAPTVTEFSFHHGTDRLVGDLVLPPWPGPAPAVVFVEGSGPGGRDQRDWATRLAGAGFASLAYDKPGSGASTGDWTRQSLRDRAEETMAAVDAVGRHDGVRADAIALIGHSQGGWVAHLAPTLGDTVAAVVAVAGPGVGVLAQEEYRLTRMMPAAGFDRADVDRALALLHNRADAGAAGDPEAVYAAEAPWHDAPWYRMLAGTTPAEIAFVLRNLAYDPAAALAALSCPLLAIFGADDLFVPLDASVEAVAAAKPDAEIVVFPDADHNIRVYAGTGAPQVVDGRYRPGVRAPGFDELVVTWLRGRLTSGL